MRRRPQSAQAMVEFLIIIPVLILLIFGAVQAALIYSAKNGLNYATFQAARLGAMNHAQYSDIRRGLARGMYPMFSQVKSDRMQHTAREIDNYVLITRISPDQASFAAFAEPHEGLGVNIIPNDNLMFRSTQQTPVSLQVANLLKLRGQESAIFDPYTDPASETPNCCAVYVVGTAHECFRRWPFPEGSVVIDPWRFVESRDGITVVSGGAGKEGKPNPPRYTGC